MFITALCPTYRRPALLANSVKLWEMQDYPAHLRRLLILDDGNDFADRAGNVWALFGGYRRFASLPAKYNMLLELAGRGSPPHAYLIWEDDDVYLPGYVSAHARAFSAGAELTRPSRVLSDYPGRVVEESAHGRFHSATGFTRELIERVGGWPSTSRADFDQQLLARLASASRRTIDPWPGRRPEFVFGWHTGHPHGQGTMRSPDDETWYERAALPDQPPRNLTLAPQLDDRTRRVFDSLGIEAVGSAGFTPSPFDPYGSIVDEAIRRAEAG